MVNSFINIDGVENFRGIGGIITSDGRKVKDGIYYRSAKLDNITEKGKAQLKAMGIGLIVDFRTWAAAIGKDVLSQEFNWINIPISHGNQTTIKNEIIDRHLTKQEAKEFMKRINAELVSNHTAEFSQFFRLMLDPKNLPIICHCTAGKDRTGFATAALLSLLGVDRATIIEEYSLTQGRINHLTEKYYENEHLTPDVIEVMQTAFTANKDYLLSALSTMDLLYGNADNYFMKGLGFSMTEVFKIRELLLE